LLYEVKLAIILN